MSGRPAIFVFFAIALSCFLSCNTDKHEQVEVTFNPDSSYTLMESNVNMLVSDSGITRYKIVTQTRLIFGLAKEPYWLCPDGVYLEKFDTLFNVTASIKADTAYYYERTKLCKLNGHVDILDSENKRFQTSEMFWNVNSGSIYSDAYIKITKGDFIDEGIGFRTDQDMSVYEIYHPWAEIPIETKRKTAEEEIPKADSIEKPPI